MNRILGLLIIYIACSSVGLGFSVMSTEERKKGIFEGKQFLQVIGGNYLNSIIRTAILDPQYPDDGENKISFEWHVISSSYRYSVLNGFEKSTIGSGHWSAYVSRKDRRLEIKRRFNDGGLFIVECSVMKTIRMKSRRIRYTAKIKDISYFPDGEIIEISGD